MIWLWYGYVALAFLVVRAILRLVDRVAKRGLHLFDGCACEGQGRRCRCRGAL